jgi:dipeptidyl aminopeptidase/acylaminoacyl peptidase
MSYSKSICRWVPVCSFVTLGALATAAAATLEAPVGGYREPAAAVVRLLTATPPPQPLVHVASGRVALLFRNPLVRLERLGRPYLGLAGYRFDPQTRTSGIEPLIARVEVIPVDDSADTAPVVWRPEDGALLDDVHFSPDGRYLSALRVGDGPARLALFDVTTGKERVLDTPINPAWEDPCTWVSAEALLCKLVPEGLGDPPPPQVVPSVMEHLTGPAPIRTYANRLDNAYEEALFEHYFTAEIGRVGLDGGVQRVPETRGLLLTVEPSPGGDRAVVRRVQRPYSNLVPARQFPSSIEIWNLAAGERRYASPAVGFGVESEDGETRAPRRFAWTAGPPAALGWIEEGREDDGTRFERWMAIEEPFTDVVREIARSEEPILGFGWTTAGTPYLFTRSDETAGVRILVVNENGVREVWRGSTKDRYENPGRGVRVNGTEGPVLEVDGRVFLAGDGLGPEGPQPFLDTLDPKTGKKERVFTAESGDFEVVIAVLDADGPTLLTSRETETEPPNLSVLRGSERRPLRRLATPYPDLEDVQRKLVSYERADGVALTGTLYLPAGWKGDRPLPTLVWIYPYEFSDREHAEQLDVRRFRFHQVKGPSPLAAVLEGYAVLLNPTVPIVQEGAGATDKYIEQLVASAEAAVDYLVATGVSEPGRIAVGGRSYGAFSSANLLVHSRRFATAIPMSGAYNRTLTPFGFQHEKRSFWDATALYADISPFFHADRIEAPILLVHGGADENAGTPTIQARRFFHALVGQGVPARYVEVPFEGHHYWARENVLHVAAEMIEWLDRTIGRNSPSAEGMEEPPAAPPAGQP